MIEKYEKPKRDKKGRLLPGETPNRAGANGNRHAGLAPWKVRMGQLATKYSSYSKLMSLFTLDKDTGLRVPTKEFMDMNPIDTGLIWQLIGQNEGNDKRLERESFWDRLDGKPKENKTVRVINSVKDLTDEELEKLAEED